MLRTRLPLKFSCQNSVRQNCYRMCKCLIEIQRFFFIQRVNPIIPLLYDLQYTATAAALLASVAIFTLNLYYTAKYINILILEPLPKTSKVFVDL